jgi:hypothetical protein
MSDKAFSGLPHSLVSGERVTVGASCKVAVMPPEQLGGCMLHSLSWETSACGLLLELRVNWQVIARGVELGTGGSWSFGRGLMVAMGADAVAATLINQTASTIYVRALNVWALNK